MKYHESGQDDFLSVLPFGMQRLSAVRKTYQEGQAIAISLGISFGESELIDNPYAPKL